MKEYQRHRLWMLLFDFFRKCCYVFAEVCDDLRAQHFENAEAEDLEKIAGKDILDAQEGPKRR